MSEIVFFLEERSAEALLDGLLPRLLPPGILYRCVVFEGKQDLERQIVRRMRGYRTPGSRFVVMRDQDAGDCSTAKATLKAKCEEAGHPNAVVRIACREIESWYLADLTAVERGLEASGIQQLQRKRVYRAPDETVKPSRILARIVPRYQKISGSRAIGPHLDLSNGRSRSFAHFVSAVRQIAATI
jgi:hypothetical protein